MLIAFIKKLIAVVISFEEIKASVFVIPNNFQCSLTSVLSIALEYSLMRGFLWVGSCLAP
jgi:hypothetical protein